MPKVGMPKKQISLPLKQAKDKRFIDKAIEKAKLTPGADKYAGHGEWKSRCTLLKFSKTK